jgi:hypothetical protein
MRCAWREVASYVDVWWVPLFFGLILFMFWAFFFVERPWRREQSRHWWLEPRHLSREQRQKFDQWLRDTGRGWLLRTRRIWLAAVLLVFAWPFISPTFCENVKCSGAKGLAPRMECLPENASGKAAPFANCHRPAAAAPHARNRDSEIRSARKQRCV